MSTSLTNILNAMNRFQTIASVEEKDKVRDIDSALALIKVDYKFPFRRRKTSIRAFKNVKTYALPSDYDELSFLDPNTKQEIEDRNVFKFQSYDEFLQDKDYRNDWAEIHQDGTVKLGMRKNFLGGERLLDNCQSDNDFLTSGDITSISEDVVNFYEGAGSIRINITASANTATISKVITGFSDSLIRTKYPFYELYIPSGVTVPTSFTLRFGVNSSNYFYKVVTTQFDGSAFEAGAWNKLAFDIDTADTTGSVPTTSTWAYFAIVFTGASTGTYFLDAIYLREWKLLDLWYFSKNMVQLSGGSFQEGFLDSNDDYVTTSVLIGPIEWAYLVQYEAMLRTLADKADNDLFTKIVGLRNDADKKIKSRYKSVTPKITNSRWNFKNDFRVRNTSIIE